MPKKNSLNKSLTQKPATAKAVPQTPFNFEQSFPTIAEWINERGWIEIGQQDDFSGAFVRALDAGGMVWEGTFSYPSLDHALCALENGLEKWMEANG